LAPTSFTPGGIRPFGSVRGHIPLGIGADFADRGIAAALSGPRAFGEVELPKQPPERRTAATATAAGRGVTSFVHLSTMPCSASSTEVGSPRRRRPAPILRRVAVPVPPGGARVGGFGPTATLKTHTWATWMQNAYESEERAHEARAALIEEVKEGRPRESVTTEMRWAMRAVSESASAIEAVGGDVLDAMGATEGSERPAWRRVLANAGHAANLEAAAWEERLDWLFKLRNETVHSKPTPAEPVVHPLGREFMGSVSSEAAKLTCESATRAVEIAAAFIRAVVENPRDDPAAQTWSKQVGDLARSTRARSRR
jgi:hypothetical protein